MLEGTAWLFCPADRADRFDKAAAAADIVILDLEDGVAPADRPRARENLQHTRLDPARTVVRVSPSGTTDHAQDVSAAGSAGYRTIMLAKAETAGQAASLSGFGVIALGETP